MSDIHTEVKSQEIQNSSDMLIGEGYNLNNPGNIPGFKQTTNFTANYAKNNTKKKGREPLQSSFLICHVSE